MVERVEPGYERTDGLYCGDAMPAWRAGALPIWLIVAPAARIGLGGP
jgi:hypothetical protein